LVDGITKLNMGCHYFGINVSLLACADDIVLLAPCWCGMQSLLNFIKSFANEINVLFGTEELSIWF